MEVGTIGWVDLTVNDAEGLRDFYQAVTGWTPSPVAMGEYSDFNMNVAAGRPVAGICHARGSNAGQPTGWMIYIAVANLDESIATCAARGGEVVHGPRFAGNARFCVIRDPAGAHAALYQA